MREIKFRAFYDSCVFNVSNIEWCACEPFIPVNIQGWRLIDGKVQTFWWHDGDEKDCILIQTMGLYDRNGREMFESDIVNLCGIIAIINFNKKGCSFELIRKGKKKDYVSSGSMYLKNELEVIGNIYENPELLTSFPEKTGRDQK